MSRNALLAIIGILVVAAGVLGYEWYAEREKSDRVEINIGKSGLSIEKK